MAAPVESRSLRPEVVCNGAPLSPEEHNAADGLRITDGLGVPAYARLSFTVTRHDKDLTISPELGNDLTIKVKGSDDWVLFDGVVVGLGIELGSGTAQNVIVEAYDKLYMLGRESHAVTHLEKSPADVVRELAQAAGLDVAIDDGFGQAVRPAAYQYGTAYAYIDSMVREAGYEWHVADKKLHVTPRSGGDSSPLIDVAVAGNLVSFSARTSATDFVDDVTVTGWDALRKETIVGTARSDLTGLRSTTDAVDAQTIQRSRVGGTSALSIPRPVADQDEAEMLATGIMHRREASLLRARGELEPSKGVVPGVLLDVKGLIADWNGRYYVTEVEHLWGKNTSLRTFFEVGAAEPESLVDLFGGSGSATLDRMLGGLTVGIVTNNDDPDALNRVKVKLPYLSDDQETAWARVLQPGSGKSRGWTVLPEVDDEVLVGFEHGSIDHPYVLGGLVNGSDKPKYTGSGLVKNGKVGARVFSSRLGHEIYISDGAASDQQFVRINTAGNEATVFIGTEKIDVEAQKIPIKVFNEKGSIEINKDGDIQLKGANIVLKSTQDITIDAGANVNIKSKASTAVTAKAKLDLKANAPATLESSAITSVKGSMVKIN